MTRDITITNALGMNANNSPLLVQRANTFKSSIWIQKDDRRVNAKSLLGVLSLAISGGSTVTLIADGPDETDAISGLELLVSTEI